MSEPNTLPRYRVGDIVTIRDARYGPVKIVEDRGNLGPNRTRVYRLMYRKKPPAYIEVREDQLEPVTKK